MLESNQNLDSSVTVEVEIEFGRVAYLGIHDGAYEQFKVIECVNQSIFKGKLKIK